MRLYYYHSLSGNDNIQVVGVEKIGERYVFVYIMCIFAVYHVL